MNNNEIRAVATKAGVRLWEIADKLGIVDSSFSRKLRKKLTPEENNHIREIIKKIASERRRY